MSVYSDIDTRLGDASLAALVADRIWRGRADSTETRPYVVWTLTSGTPERAVDGAKTITPMQFQFSCFADSLGAAHQVADAVKALLDGWSSTSIKRATVTSEQEISEDDWGGWHIPVEVNVRA